MTDAKIRAVDVAYVDRLRKERAALLAVAKACDQADPDRQLAGLITWSACLAELDATHPGWREWTDEPPPSYPIIHGRPHDARTAWDHE